MTGQFDLLTETPTGIATMAENPSFEGVEMQPDDWLLLALIDGKATIKEVFDTSPLSKEATQNTLWKLQRGGIVRLPEPPKDAAETVANKAVRLPPIPKTWPQPYAEFTFTPRADVDIDPAFQKAVAYFHEHLDQVNYYQLLDLNLNASPALIKASYFNLSKFFHPDRFFRRNIGPFAPVIGEIFKWLNDAYRTLSNTQRRQAYDIALSSATPCPIPQKKSASLHSPSPNTSPPTPAPAPPEPPPQQPPSTPKVRPLAEVLGQAKLAERKGDFRIAADAFLEALQQRKSPDLMNRAAECLIKLRQELDLAERLSKEALEIEPNNARFWVAWAYLVEQRGALAEAEQAYAKAVALDPNHSGARSRLAAVQAKARANNET